MSETFDSVQAIKEQFKFCSTNKVPHFAPLDGKCYRCNRNIYMQVAFAYIDKVLYSGISVEKASSELITGCPHCHRSYCD